MIILTGNICTEWLEEIWQYNPGWRTQRWDTLELRQRRQQHTTQSKLKNIYTFCHWLSRLSSW